MDKAVLFGALVVIILVVLYIAGTRKGGFVKYFSRSAYMRDLNDKMEEK